MLDNFLQYGQLVVLVLSILSLYLVSSVKHEKRLQGYALTGVSRFSGAAIFIFFDLYAFVIANLIQTYIAFDGYRKNKKLLLEKYSSVKFIGDARIIRRDNFQCHLSG